MENVTLYTQMCRKQNNVSYAYAFQFLKKAKFKKKCENIVK